MVSIDATVYYRIITPRKAVYYVGSVNQAMTNLSLATIKCKHHNSIGSRGWSSYPSRSTWIKIDSIRWDPEIRGQKCLGVGTYLPLYIGNQCWKSSYQGHIVESRAIGSIVHSNEGIEVFISS